MRKLERKTFALKAKKISIRAGLDILDLPWLGLTCCAWTWHKSLCQMPLPLPGATWHTKMQGESEGVARGERHWLSAMLALAVCVCVFFLGHVRGIFELFCQGIV